MRTLATFLFVHGILVLLVTSPALGDPRLPSLFSDHMVLQRERAVPIWGWADPGEKVTVELAGQSQGAVADRKGRWSVALDPMKAGGPYRLVVKGSAGPTATVEDVLVGEVWICSGQSNMAWPVRAAKNAQAEIAAADYPEIRLLSVPLQAAEEPRDSVDVRWVVCGTDTVATHSAVSYYFGRELHQRLGVPIGLVNTSYGGTRAEAWTRRKALDALPALKSLLEKWDGQAAAFDEDKAKAAHGKRLAEWRKAAEKARAEKRRPPRKPVFRDPRLNRHRPAGLWNGMVAPLTPYAIRGAIWYQGESNAPRAEQYRVLFPALVRDWRAAWGQGEFPFYFVQLANFKPERPEPVESAWAELRDAQLHTLRTVEGTGMAVIIDIGEAKNIHPRNKQEVGLRLALWALANDYGEDVEFSGPLYASSERKGSRIVLRFDHSKGGLVAGRDGDLAGFAIAGRDRKFVWANAKIQGERVLVWHPDVRRPAAVRYAWADNPACNLTNRAGLPASPFRTDDWPGLTAGK